MAEKPTTYHEKRSRRIGLFLYFLGLLLGLILAILAIWGDLEASLFDVLSKPDRTLTSLSCPILITADEKTALIKANLKNDRDRVENLMVWAHISLGRASLIREEETRFTLLPGDAQLVEWPISADDAAWNRIVLVRVGTVRNLPYPQRVGAACGVLVIPVKGITGGQIVVATLLASMIFLIFGALLWGVGRHPLHTQDMESRKMMMMFVGLVGAALLLSFLKLWLLGLLVILLILLLMVNFISS